MKKLKCVKKRVFEIIGVTTEKDKMSKLFDIFVIMLVTLNVFILVLETFEISLSFRNILINIEMISVIIFMIEYLLRIWTAEFLYPHCNKYLAKVKYIFSAVGMIDLLAILPTLVPNFMPKGIIVIRTCRTLRILKLFKIKSRFNALRIVSRVIKNKFSQLASIYYIIGSLMLTSSILMYNAEHAVQPEIFKNAFSGFWWTVSTIATIGYGDIYPVTLIGKILGIIITILGISVVGIPTAILTAGFIEESNSRSSIRCPHCGEKISHNK